MRTVIARVRSHLYVRTFSDRRPFLTSRDRPAAGYTGAPLPGCGEVALRCVGMERVDRAVVRMTSCVRCCCVRRGVGMAVLFVNCIHAIFGYRAAVLTTHSVLLWSRVSALLTYVVTRVNHEHIASVRATALCGYMLSRTVDPFVWYFKVSYKHDSWSCIGSGSSYNCPG